MDNINVTIRLEKELKEQADQFFNGLGMTLSTAVNVFIRQSLSKGKIPFELEAIKSAATPSRRIGFMKDDIIMADNFDFDSYMQDEIEAMFYGEVD